MIDMAKVLSSDWQQNENGFWLRLSNGIQICWDHVSVTDQSIANAYGSLWQGTRVMTYAKPFSVAPVVTPEVFKWGSSASWATLGGAPGTTTVSLRGIDVNSRATGTACIIGYIAIGKWK